MPGSGDEPTAAWRPGDDDPTRVVPTTPEPTRAYQPPPPPPPPPPTPRRDNAWPWIVAVGLVAIVLVVALVLLLAHRSNKSGSGTTSTVPSTTAAVTSTTVAVTLPSLPVSTAPSTTGAPTTVGGPGNRAPTPDENTAIRTDDRPTAPNATIDLVRISDSDATWAVDRISPTPGHEGEFQPVYHVLHLEGSTWTKVAEGTSEVDCGGNVPPNVVADFADVLGPCASSG
jgi:hypothetical protein